MPNVFIVHGLRGSPEENWIPWLKGELEQIGCAVYTPRFPTPKGQSLESWTKAFEPFRQHVDGNTVFVGHSLGSTFIMNLLEGLDRKVRATFFVAGFITPVVDPKSEYNAINRSFYDRKFDFRRIRANCCDFFVINSDNDPVVTLSVAKKLSGPLGAMLTVIEGAGHFNTANGYTKFPQLLDMIEDVLTTNPGD